MTKVAYEIHTEYKGYRLHAYIIATFENDEMRGHETTYVDSNGRSWVDYQKPYMLSQWQKEVAVDEFFRVMVKCGFDPRIVD